jgi:aryl-alcohol dehydrogenase-like predicted oxidoreductase
MPHLWCSGSSRLGAKAGAAARRRFVLSHPLLASAVVGASCLEQLQEVIAAAQKGRLSEEELEAIEEVHGLYPNPTP